MLVLSRKAEESVVIGRPHGLERMLKVTVLEIHGGAVRLGFETSTDFPVHRWEAWSGSGPRGRLTPRRQISRLPLPGDALAWANRPRRIIRLNPFRRLTASRRAVTKWLHKCTDTEFQECETR